MYQIGQWRATSITLEAYPADSVASLKAAWKVRNGWPADDPHFHLRSPVLGQLQDGHTLERCGVRHGAVLYMVDDLARGT